MPFNIVHVLNFFHVLFCQMFFLDAIASPCSFRCRCLMVSSAGYISGPDIASLGLRACFRFNVHWFEKWSFQTKQQDTGWSPPLDSMFKKWSFQRNQQDTGWSPPSCPSPSSRQPPSSSPASAASSSRPSSLTIESENYFAENENISGGLF